MQNAFCENCPLNRTYDSVTDLWRISDCKFNGSACS